MRVGVSFSETAYRERTPGSTRCGFDVFDNCNFIGFELCGIDFDLSFLQVQPFHISHRRSRCADANQERCLLHAISCIVLRAGAKTARSITTSRVEHR
jgi:hypothetical protein